MATATATSTIVDEPTIFGPLSSVNLVTGAGLFDTLDWVTTRGLTASELNAAQWQTALSPGIYRVDAWIPGGYGEYGETYARYFIVHSGQESEVRLHQKDFSNAWITLGVYQYDGSEASVRSTDAAGVQGERLVWDGLRWTRISNLPLGVEVKGDKTTVAGPEIAGPEDSVVRYAGVGYHGYLIAAYARGVNAETVNSATWSAPIAAGAYAVEVYVPSQHAEAEVGYTVHALGGDVTATVPQSDYRDVWVPIGIFRFGEAGGSVTSSDATGVFGQELAWSAMRFTVVPVPPGEGGGSRRENSPLPPGEIPPESPARSEVSHARPAGGIEGMSVSCPSMTSSGRVSMKGGCEVAEVERLDHVKLIKFDVHPIYPGGPGEAYEVMSLAPLLDRYKLHYRCEPCLFMGKTVPAGTRIPVTYRSQRQGDARELVGKVLYVGSAFQMTMREGLRLPIRFVYHLPGRGEVLRQDGCIVSVGHHPRACTH